MSNLDCRGIEIVDNTSVKFSFTVIHCNSPNEPLNGFLYSPCPTHYGSECSFGCDSGYFAESRTLTCDENGFWEPQNVSCNGKYPNLYTSGYCHGVLEENLRIWCFITK